jgi:hypothetical protein
MGKHCDTEKTFRRRRRERERERENVRRLEAKNLKEGDVCACRCRSAYSGSLVPHRPHHGAIDTVNDQSSIAARRR